MPSKKRFIAVAGNMGAGKSELVSFLCRRYGLKPFYEPNETNPYLADFYADMKAWASTRRSTFSPTSSACTKS